MNRSPGPLGVGSFYSWGVKMFGIPVEGFEVITDFVPNKHMTEKSSNAMVGTWDYTFEPEGSGTRVTMEHRQRSLWSVPPLRNLMDYAMPRLSRSYVEAVKGELEGGSSLPRQRKPAASKPRKEAGGRQSLSGSRRPPARVSLGVATDAAVTPGQLHPCDGLCP